MVISQVQVVGGYKRKLKADKSGNFIECKNDPCI